MKENIYRIYTYICSLENSTNKKGDEYAKKGGGKVTRNTPKEEGQSGFEKWSKRERRKKEARFVMDRINKDPKSHN